MDKARPFVLAGGGEFLDAIVVGYGHGHVRAIVDDFRQWCPCVTSLSIYDPQGIWASTFGEQT